MMSQSLLQPRRPRLVTAAFILFFQAQSFTAYSEARSPQSRRDAVAEFDSLTVRADKAKEADQLDEAAALYSKALALRPDWAAGWWSLGTIHYDRSEYPAAARAFEKVVALDTKAGTARVMLGLCEFELGQDDSALAHIQQGRNIGVAEDPQLRQVMFFHEGVLLQRKGRFEAAQEALASLCLSGVQSDEVGRILGMVALRLRDRNPPAGGTSAEDVVRQVGRAECLAGQKKIDEARSLYEAVVSAYPTFPDIHYAYGKFLLDNQDNKAGVAQMEQEIRNNSGHVFARLQIAAAWYKVDSAAGLPYAEAAVKLDPKYPFGHYLLGLLLLDTDDFQRAIPELEVAAGAYTHEAKVFFALGAAYARAGREEDAMRARATFVRLNQENAALSTDDSGQANALQKKAGGALDIKPPQ